MQFEKLDVWKRAIVYTSEIYNLTATFPIEERYGLTSQLRRASTSISLNIAEGSGRGSNNDYCRFIDIAIGSALECVSALYICRNLNLLNINNFELHYNNAEIIIKNYIV